MTFRFPTSRPGARGGSRPVTGGARRGGARAAGALGAALAVGLLTACAQEPLIGETTWQVTAIYTEPGTTAAVPGPAAGLAQLAFGTSTVSGFTGCVPLQAEAAYTDAAGERRDPEDAERITFSRVTVDDAPGDCVGGARHVHDELVALLDGPFEVSHPGDSEMVLTQVSDAIDAPAIRLVAG